MKEEWKTIESCQGYEVSNTGKVRNKKTGRILKQNKRRGYPFVVLMNSKNEKKDYYVHRLVALAFIPNPSGFPQVNHRDGNKNNNSVENLEWCTARMNIQHACELGLIDHYKIPVVQIDKQGNIVNVFGSMTEAFMITGINICNISLVVHKKRRSAGGYNWVPAK